VGGDEGEGGPGGFYYVRPHPPHACRQACIEKEEGKRWKNVKYIWPGFCYETVDSIRWDSMFIKLFGFRYHKKVICLDRPWIFIVIFVRTI
jgi:hypothetical protein